MVDTFTTPILDSLTRNAFTTFNFDWANIDMVTFSTNRLETSCLQMSLSPSRRRVRPRPNRWCWTAGLIAACGGLLAWWATSWKIGLTSASSESRLSSCSQIAGTCYRRALAGSARASSRGNRLPRHYGIIEITDKTALNHFVAVVCVLFVEWHR